jgi:hypothetical protein
MLKSSHRPDGRLTFCLLFAGRRCRCLWRHSVNRELPDPLQHSCLCARSRSKFPIAPMGDSCSAPCLQGGGVYVRGGTVSILNSQIYSNTVFVRALLRPDGKITYVLVSTLALGKLLTCLPQLSLAQLRPILWSTIADTLVNCKCCRDLESSHRPHG